jgi:hypothetical protein
VGDEKERKVKMENSAETQPIFKASLISQPTVAAQKYNTTMDKPPPRVFIASLYGPLVGGRDFILTRR